MPHSAPTSTPAPPPPASLTAEFRNAASAHDGRNKVTVELHFSENIPELSYKTVRDSVLRITNGRIVHAPHRYVTEEAIRAGSSRYNQPHGRP